MQKKPAAILSRLMLMFSVAVLAAAFLAVGIRSPILLWIAAGAAAMKGLRRVPELWTHGTARLATFTQELLTFGLLGDRGLIMGRAGVAERTPIVQGVRYLADPRIRAELACKMFLGSLFRSRRSGERMIRINPFVHALTVAPAGKGKSVSVLVPNLLSYQGSCVVCDPKAELWKLTAAHRRDKLGHRVFFLNPFGMHGARSDTFNPLDFIDASSPDFLSKCRDLANQLVVRTGEEREPHWNDATELLLCANRISVCGRLARSGGSSARPRLTRGRSRPCSRSRASGASSPCRGRPCNGSSTASSARS
jgi:type IV secretion system protein VirD4